ncbi:MAG TPA: TetR/AcrR family transcriptional regulator [Pseudonocardia sp.]|jgi:AcrR family transcriptional regulator|uniref:TetR/AcrR family transcriptional regulator n=1 Tax=Pseudonocardia sp. TaxID=60912 RepID=UPI002B4AFBBD|nr:TetR/AcrR family transcriptional regulator [Pseudonocardia sp.]HLU55183.1 TetR/AcrR family transcriptional regulator [Pseudonocardia sp.]
MGGEPERDRLLRLVADYVLEHGITGMTLRALGRAIGTNNRMLLYYFGSKEQLIAQALAEAARRFPAFTAAMAALDDRGVPLLDRLLAVWRGIAAPENLPFLRLFFEVFGQAVHNPGRFDAFLARVGHDWTNQVAGALQAEGIAPAEAAALAREIVAVWRGLQFDLLSTGDADAVAASYSATAAAFARRCAAARSAQPAS